MAAYFHGGASTDIQAGADGLQTLYLMNPSYAEYTDAGAAATPATANMLLLNSAISSMAPGNYGHQPSPAAQHFVGIPLQPPPSGYNLWAPAATATASTDVSPTQGAGAGAVSAVLSLSSREAPPVTVAAVAGDEPTPPHGLVMNSKYLKAAQELLDEVVSVGKGVEEAKLSVKSAAKKKEDSEGGSGGGRTEDGKSGGGAEMSTAERQELQMKKAKLVSMLDEVEQRYRQYHHQMQAVASSFEAVAGPGSARTYTALALQTISRQFRCLRDAIASQVRAASRALGEDADGKTVGSRLRYIDHQLRQQRALQQLGMMQHGAWRPQRGLPERSVSILRAWLFEHFLHPYPKDSDKVMLAKQTGLTRSQVSNWFINARVRLWKPMVEEMYLEETKDQEPNGRGGATAGDDNSGSKSNNTDNVEPAKPETAISSGTTKAPLVASTDASFLLLATSELAGEQQNQQSYYSDDGTGALQPKLKKARADDPPPAFHVPDAAALRAQAAAASHRELLMKFMEGGSAAATARDHQPSAAGYSLFTPAYGQFSPEQFAFAGHGHGQGHGHGGVSLTLGLPHGAAEQTPFLMEHGGDTGDSSSAGGYDIGMQSRKPFALMRDFVA